MIRRSLPILLSLACPLTLHAQADPNGFNANKIPLNTSESGGFLMTKAKMDGKDVNLVIDSGALLEIVMKKQWVIDQKKELKPLGTGQGVGGKAEVFSTHFNEANIGGAIKLLNLEAKVIDLKFDVAFKKPEDGTALSTDGLIGSTFLRKSQSVVSYADNQILIPAAGTPDHAYLAKCLAAGDRVVPMLRTPNGYPMVTINFGEKEFVFLVDTAAGSSVLLPEVTKELGLKTSSTNAEMRGAGGTTTASETCTAENILVGGVLKLGSLPFVVMQTPGGEVVPAGTRYGGILGNPFLKQLKVRMDFGSLNLMLPPRGESPEDPGTNDNKKVIRLNPGADPEQAVGAIIDEHFDKIPLTRSTNGHYYVQATINDKARWMCVDSGADGMMLDNSVAKEDGIELTAGPTAKGIDGKAFPSSNGKLKSFKVGPTNFEGPTMMFTDLSNFSKLTMADGTTHPSAGQLGTAYFKAMPVAVDFPNCRMLLAKSKIQGGLTGVKAQLGSPVAPMVEDAKGLHYLVVEVAGRKALLLVDIGTSSSVLFDKSAEELKIETYEIPGSVTTLGAKKMPRKGAKLQGLKLGKHELAADVELMVLPSPIETVSDLPVIGMAGSSLFEALKSTVDFSTNEFTLSSSFLKKNP